MYPATDSEAITTGHLVLAANPLAPAFAEFATDAIAAVALRWFDSEVGVDLPLLLWLRSAMT